MASLSGLECVRQWLSEQRLGSTRIDRETYHDWLRDRDFDVAAIVRECFRRGWIRHSVNLNYLVASTLANPFSEQPLFSHYDILPAVDEPLPSNLAEAPNLTESERAGQPPEPQDVASIDDLERSVPTIDTAPDDWLKASGVGVKRRNNQRSYDKIMREYRAQGVGTDSFRICRTGIVARIDANGEWLYWKPSTPGHRDDKNPVVKAARRLVKAARRLV